MYKSFLFSVLLIAVSIAAFAQVPSPSTPQILLEDGNVVGATHPMPVISSATIGTATVDPNTPPTTNLMTSVSVTSSAANVTSIVNRKSISVFNTSTTDTCWASLDAGTASAAVNASIPIPPLGYITTELASAKVLSLVASVSLTAVVYQDGY